MQMKKFRLFSLMISLLATAVTFSACSDDEDEPNVIPTSAPTVTLAKGEVTAESIAFTLTPANAVKARWIYFEEGTREVTAEQVLTNGLTADADKASELEATPLNPETAYVIYAAVEGEDGTQVLSDPLEVTTLASEGPERVEFAAAEASAESYPSQSSGYNLWMLTLKDEAQNELCVNLCASLDADPNYLPEGKFDTENPESVGKMLLDSDSHVTIDGVRNTIASGFIETAPDLEEPGEVYYLIEGELTLTDGRVVSVMYEGPIEGCKAPEPAGETVEIHLNQAQLKDLERPAGEFFVGLNDTDWHYEGTLAFKAAETDTYLPSGHYSLAEGTILGDNNSSISGYGYEAPGYGYDWKSCEAEVALEDGLYYMDVNIETNAGKKFHIYFEGEIAKMPVPTVVMIENPFIQVDFYEDGQGGYEGPFVIMDANPNKGPYTVVLSLWVHSETAYLNGEYLWMTAEEAAAAGVKNYIENSKNSSYGLTYGPDGPSDEYLFFKSSYIGAQTLMPSEDNNMFSIELVCENGTIYRTMYMGPLYGGGSVPSEPIIYPFYSFSSAEVVNAMGPYISINFTTNGGLLTLHFYCNSDTFGAGKYVYDPFGESPMTFMGGYMEYAMDGGEDKSFEINGGTIGVVAPSDINGNKWTFQFKDVLGTVDGRDVIFGELQDDGTYLCTPSVATIKGI